MVLRAVRGIHFCRYRDRDSALFARPELRVFGLALVHYQVKRQSFSPGIQSITLTFTCGLLSLSRAKEELSRWAVNVAGKSSLTDTLLKESYPHREGDTTFVAPYVYRDYRLRNFAETHVSIHIQPTTLYDYFPYDMESGMVGLQS